MRARGERRQAQTSILEKPYEDITSTSKLRAVRLVVARRGKRPCQLGLARPRRADQTEVLARAKSLDDAIGHDRRERERAEPSGDTLHSEFETLGKPGRRSAGRHPSRVVEARRLVLLPEGRRSTLGGSGPRRLAQGRETLAQWLDLCGVLFEARSAKVRECVEDLAQDALAHAFVTLAQMGEAPPNARAWLFRVASNLWIDRTRPAERRREEPIAEQEGAAHSTDPRATREAAGTLLGQLSPYERAALALLVHKPAAPGGACEPAVLGSLAVEPCWRRHRHSSWLTSRSGIVASPLQP
jgi:hypothetical protein